jgi:hypothetical protein
LFWIVMLSHTLPWKITCASWKVPIESGLAK